MRINGSISSLLRRSGRAAFGRGEISECASASPATPGFALLSTSSLSSARAGIVAATQLGQTGSQSENGTRTPLWLWAGATILPFALTSSVAMCEPNDEARPDVDSKAWSVLGLDSKQKIFFKYEKRIRDKSTLEKVFDYFASVEKEGVRYMVASDLLNAIVATFPSSQSNQERAGSLDGECLPCAGCLDTCMLHVWPHAQQLHERGVHSTSTGHIRTRSIRSIFTE